MKRKGSIWDIQSPKRWETLLIMAGNLLLSIPNALYIYRGFFTRLWADDYCFSGILRQYGFLAGLGHFYTHVSNRFSAFVLSAFLDLAGKRVGYLVPAVIIVLVFILTLVIQKAAKTKDGIWASLLLAQLVVFFTLYTAPDLTQSVYWRSGMIHYFLPLVFLLWLLYLIFASAGKQFPMLVIILLLSFFSAGSSESFAALQTGSGLLILAFTLLSKISNRKVILPRVLLLLAGSIAAMVVMVVAPGNRLRLELLTQAPDLSTLITLSLQFALDFVIQSVRGLWLPMGVLWVTAGVFGIFAREAWQDTLVSKKRVLLSLLLIPLITYLLIVCICAPTAYGMMAFPENRVLMLARFMTGMGIAAHGLLSGWFIRGVTPGINAFHFATGIILLLLLLYPLRPVPKVVREIEIARERAAVWDERDLGVRKDIDRGESVILVRALDSFSQIAELRADSDFWVNRCAAQYYGVESIVALEE